MCFVVRIFWWNQLAINSLLVSVSRWNSWLEKQDTCVIASTVAFRCFWWIITLIFNDIHKPVLGLIGLIIANQYSLQRKITMQERHLYWPPYFFPWPRSAPPTFFILESPLGTAGRLSQQNDRRIRMLGGCVLRRGLHGRKLKRLLGGVKQ